MKSQEIVIVNALEYELREAADFLVKHSDECDPAYLASVAETMLRAAQALATLGEARGGTWQPIETAPEAEKVLIWLPNYGHDSAYRTGRDWFTVRGEGSIVYPTHWQPLPTPPQTQEAK